MFWSYNYFSFFKCPPPEQPLTPPPTPPLPSQPFQLDGLRLHGSGVTPATPPPQTHQELSAPLILQTSRETSFLSGLPPTRARSMTSLELARSPPVQEASLSPTTTQATGFSSLLPAPRHQAPKSPHGFLTPHGATLTSKLLPPLEPLQPTQSLTPETVISPPLMPPPLLTPREPPPSQTLLDSQSSVPPLLPSQAAGPIF